MKSKCIILLLLFAIAGIAQEGTPVRISDDPANSAVTFVYTVNGSNQTTAICLARSVLTTGQRPATKVSISAISKASPAVVTSASHGFPLSARPSVTISGATGTGWVSGANTVNGTFIATIIDADTFSIATSAGVPVDTSGNGTLAGTVIFTTTAPRLSVEDWAVQKIDYDGSGNAIWKGWLAGSSAYRAKCSDASSTSVQQQ